MQLKTVKLRTSSTLSLSRRQIRTCEFKQLQTCSTLSRPLLGSPNRFRFLLAHRIEAIGLGPRIFIGSLPTDDELERTFIRKEFALQTERYPHNSERTINAH